jgi:hypothetical protein
MGPNVCDSIWFLNLRVNFGRLICNSLEDFKVFGEVTSIIAIDLLF